MSLVVLDVVKRYLITVAIALGYSEFQWLIRGLKADYSLPNSV
jgi:hypothetical protein